MATVSFPLTNKSAVKPATTLWARLIRLPKLYIALVMLKETEEEWDEIRPYGL